MDLQLIETDSGGDIVFNGSDLEVINGFQNLPYLGMYGGNVKESTKEYLQNEERFDFWGNNLLMPRNSSIQFNSNIERLLNGVVITSSSRIQIEETVREDLSFMDEFADVEVNVFLESTEKLNIYIKITELNRQQSQNFVYIWDATKKELTNG